LALSLPTRSKRLSLASVAINTLLLTFCIDFTYTPYLKAYDPIFTRVGAVDSSSAKILVRYPALEEQHQLRIVYRQVAPGIAPVGNTWKHGPVLDIEEDKDFTAFGKLARLWPSSDYECA
jgi:alkaline phosphatase D